MRQIVCMFAFLFICKNVLAFSITNDCEFDITVALRLSPQSWEGESRGMVNQELIKAGTTIKMRSIEDALLVISKYSEALKISLTAFKCQSGRELWLGDIKITIHPPLNLDLKFSIKSDDGNSCTISSFH